MADLESQNVRQRRNRFIGYSLVAVLALVVGAAAFVSRKDNLASQVFPGVNGGAATSPTGTSRLRQVKSNDVFDLAREPGAKITVVNVWATWCGPCQEEMPELVKFKKVYESKGVRLVLVSANEIAEGPEAEKFLSSVGADFPSYILGETPGSFVTGMKPDWSGGLPATFLLDPEGKIKKFWVGASTFADLAAKVDPLLTP